MNIIKLKLFVTLEKIYSRRNKRSYIQKVASAWVGFLYLKSLSQIYIYK